MEKPNWDEKDLAENEIVADNIIELLTEISKMLNGIEKKIKASQKNLKIVINQIYRVKAK